MWIIIRIAQSSFGVRDLENCWKLSYYRARNSGWVEMRNLPQVHRELEVHPPTQIQSHPKLYFSELGGGPTTPVRVAFRQPHRSHSGLGAIVILSSVRSIKIAEYLHEYQRYWNKVSFSIFSTKNLIRGVKLLLLPNSY